MGAPSLTGPGPSRGSDPALARVGQSEMQGCLCPPQRPLPAWPGVALGTCRCRSCSLLGQCCRGLCCLCSSLSSCPLPRGAVASSSPLVQKHGLPWSPSSDLRKSPGQGHRPSKTSASTCRKPGGSLDAVQVPSHQPLLHLSWPSEPQMTFIWPIYGVIGKAEPLPIPMAGASVCSSPDVHCYPAATTWALWFCLS